MILSILLFIFQLNTATAMLPDSAEFRNQFIEASTRCDTTAMLAAWRSQVAALDAMGETGKADQAARECLRIATAARNHSVMGRMEKYIAINLSDAGRREEGIAMSYEAFSHLMMAGDTVLAANTKINIGMDYNNDGQYEQALKVEIEALDLRLKCGDSTNIAIYFQHIGEVYKELGIHDKWKEFLETANRLAQNPDYSSLQTRIGILNDFGGVYEAESRYDEAVKVYTEMYELSKTENYLNGMATARSNLAPVYRNLGQPEKALECAKEAFELHDKRGSTYGRMCAFTQLGEAYLALGNLDLANKNFHLGLEEMKKDEYQNEKKSLYEGLYKVARKQQRWKDALEFYEKSIETADSIRNTELQKKLAELETRFQSSKKEQQIELLNNENALKNVRLKTQRMILWGGSLLVLLAGSIVFLFVRQRRRRLQSRQNELEQKLLRSQMNPHFIFNSLGAIQNFMMKNDGRKAAFYLSSFSSLMRSILKNSREEWITLGEEKQTLENYLELHRLRMGEKLSFSVTLAEGLDAGAILLPPMLIQPFVENAVLHGIEGLEAEGTINIVFGNESGFLKISVADNGKGFRAEKKPSERISYALQIFKERIRNLKKTAGLDIRYEIGDNPQPDGNRGTKVMVVLPLKTA